MKTKAYIDTNIFIYAIVKHPLLGETCTRILRDMKNKICEAYGSHLVTIELMGALSKIRRLA